MIQAYFDESGVSGTDSVFAFAGFVANADRWLEFSDRWSRCLRDSPSIQYFKMYEAVNLSGEFLHWRTSARDEKLRQLVEVLKPYPQRVLFAAVDTVAYSKLFGQIQHRLNSPYYVGFNSVIAGTLHDQMEMGVSDRIEVVFDEHKIYGPRMRQWYPVITDCLKIQEGLSNFVRLLPKMPRFEDDSEFPPLQAADMLVWLVRMATAEQQHEFDWINQELKDVRISPYSRAFNEETLREASSTQKYPTDITDEFVQQKMVEFGIPRAKAKRRSNRPL